MREAAQRLMTPAEAERIFNDFANLMASDAWRCNRIRDARLLPHPKSRIQEAFACLGKYCEQLKASDPAAYQRFQCDVVENLVATGPFHLAKFHDIDEEDRQVVADLNGRWDEVSATIKQATASAADLAWMGMAEAMRSKYERLEFEELGLGGFEKGHNSAEQAVSLNSTGTAALEVAQLQ
ncbi:MAG TPA: hypothetical protein VKE98_19625, partial [Gemmataceae bacterium]|nr:hypothetical protein [Gemmataceae bacterium]